MTPILISHHRGRGPVVFTSDAAWLELPRGVRERLVDYVTGVLPPHHPVPTLRATP